MLWLKYFTWIPSDAAQAFKTSSSTATTATREELKLSPASKLTALGIHDSSRWFELIPIHEYYYHIQSIEQ